MGTNKSNLVNPHVAVVANRITYSEEIVVEVYLLKNVPDDEAIEQAQMFCTNNGLNYLRSFRCSDLVVR